MNSDDDVKGSGEGWGDGIELVVVTMRFDSTDDAGLLAILSKYVVLTRMEPGCRNVDLCASYTQAGRYLLIQKWDSADTQRAHFDSPLMVTVRSSLVSRAL